MCSSRSRFELHRLPILSPPCRRLTLASLYVCFMCPQVAAHGTGASLPTVEEQIVSMKIISPALYVVAFIEFRIVCCLPAACTGRHTSHVYRIISSVCLTHWHSVWRHFSCLPVACLLHLQEAAHSPCPLTFISSLVVYLTPSTHSTAPIFEIPIESRPSENPHHSSSHCMALCFLTQRHAGAVGPGGHCLQGGQGGAGGPGHRVGADPQVHPTAPTARAHLHHHATTGPTTHIHYIYMFMFIVEGGPSDLTKIDH